MRDESTEVSAAEPDPEDLEPPQVQIAREGISRFAFVLGILAALLLPFALGRYPHHSWLVLVAGYAVLIPLWYRHVVVHRRGHWFLTELCWVSSVCIAAYFSLVFRQALSEDQLMWGFRAVFMLSAGSLSGNAMAFSYSLVFYSIEHMANVFVQVMPLVALLAVRSWEGGFSPGLIAAWAGYFPESVWDETRIADLLVAGFLPYFLWLVPYAMWLLTFGVSLPQRGYGTVFHEHYKRRVRRARVDTADVSELRCHAVFYLLAHMCLTSLSFFWALLVWLNFFVHLAWMLFVLFYFAWMGGGHYIAVTIKKFGPLLKRQRAQDAKAKMLAKAEAEARRADFRRSASPTGSIELLEAQGQAIRAGAPNRSQSLVASVPR